MPQGPPQEAENSDKTAGEAPGVRSAAVTRHPPHRFARRSRDVPRTRRPPPGVFPRRHPRCSRQRRASSAARGWRTGSGRGTPPVDGMTGGTMRISERGVGPAAAERAPSLPFAKILRSEPRAPRPIEGGAATRAPALRAGDRKAPSVVRIRGGFPEEQRVAPAPARAPEVAEPGSAPASEESARSSALCPWRSTPPPSAQAPRSRSRSGAPSRSSCAPYQAVSSWCCAPTAASPAPARTGCPISSPRCGAAASPSRAPRSAREEARPRRPRVDLPPPLR